MGRRIFVGNLAYGTNEEALRSLFDDGERTIVDVRIITDRETGKSRGFGFVELGDDAAAQSAIEKLDGVELEGRRLSLREAFDRPRGGGGGGPPGGGPRGGGPRGGGRGDEPRPPRGNGQRGNGQRPERAPSFDGPPPPEMMDPGFEGKGPGRGDRRNKKKKRSGSSRKKWDDDDW